MSYLNLLKSALGVVCSLMISGLACGETLFNEFVNSTLRFALGGDKGPTISSERQKTEKANLAIELLQCTLGFECQKEFQ